VAEDAVRFQLVSASKFPENREFNREISKIRGRMTLSSGESVNAFNLLDLNSLRTGTGNFLCTNREIVFASREFGTDCLHRRLLRSVRSK